MWLLLLLPLYSSLPSIDEAIVDEFPTYEECEAARTARPAPVVDDNALYACVSANSLNRL